MLKDKIKTNGITDKVKHHTPSFAACQEFLFVLQTTEWSVGTQCDIMICKNLTSWKMSSHFLGMSLKTPLVENLDWILESFFFPLFKIK